MGPQNKQFGLSLHGLDTFPGPLRNLSKKATAQGQLQRVGQAKNYLTNNSVADAGHDFSEVVEENKNSSYSLLLSKCK